MTRLEKPLSREMDFGRGPVIVTLDPAGLLTFRDKGRHKAWSLPLASLYVQAVAKSVEEK